MGYQVYVSGLHKIVYKLLLLEQYKVLVRRLLHLQHSLYLWTISKVRKEVKPLVTTAPLGIGSSIGLLLGGWLTSTISWRSGFLINVPFTIILIILTLLFVKSTTVHRVRIDFIGAILSVIAIMTLVYGMTNESIIAVIIGFILLIIFVIFERKLPFALMPMSLFKNKVRTGAYVGRFIFMMAMLSYWFILPQMMQHLYHYTPLQVGIAFLPLTIINFIADCIFLTLLKN